MQLALYIYIDKHKGFNIGIEDKGILYHYCLICRIRKWRILINEIEGEEIISIKRVILKILCYYTHVSVNVSSFIKDLSGFSVVRLDYSIYIE